MAISSIDIGTRKMWVAAYNPYDELSSLYERALIILLRRVIGELGVDGFHAWIKAIDPKSEEVLKRANESSDYVSKLDRYPITPGEEKYILPIITKIKELMG